MSSERTRDAEAVDLRAAGDVVVHELRAAPCAVVGAAAYAAGPAAPGLGHVQGLPDRFSWRFGWGASGELWSVRPPDATAENAPRAAAHHIFDLASLTKPVTALTLARLQREGVMHRDQPLGEVLVEAQGSPSADVPLDLLLAHRAGLEAHIEFFEKVAGASQPPPEQIFARAARARRSECEGKAPPEGFPVVYSDLGYILVGAAMERVTGRPLDELVQAYVAGPRGLALGSIRMLAKTEPAFKQRVVPTEDVAWRGGVLRGIVHDENAWVLADTGSAGHAGLFGDVWSIVRLGTSILDVWGGRKDSWLTRAELEPLVRVRPNGSHRSGFDGRGDAPSSGACFGPHTFGHLGFTGTSLWMDPDAMLVGVLLTNRVHPTRDHLAIRAARPRVYDDIFRALIG